MIATAQISEVAWTFSMTHDLDKTCTQVPSLARHPFGVRAHLVFRGGGGSSREEVLVKYQWLLFVIACSDLASSGPWQQLLALVT